MKNLIIKFIYKFNTRKFNYKVTIVFIFSILLTNALIIFTVYQLAGKEITEKSSAFVKGQFEKISENLDITLKNFIEISNIISSDNSAKEFLTNEDETSQKYNKDASEVYNLIRYILDSNSYIDYIGLVKLDGNGVVYVGEQWTNDRFREEIINGYNEALSSNFDNCKINIEKKVFDKEQYVLNIYQPVYEKYIFDQHIGILVIGIGENHINEFYSNLDKELSVKTYLTYKDGNIISNEYKDLIGTKSQYKDFLIEENGEKRISNKVIIYKNISNWDWYMVGEIPKEALLKDTKCVILIIILWVIIIDLIISIGFYKFSKSLYKPMDLIIKKMEEVSTGNLDVRINEEWKGRDFRQLTNGFNSMIQRIHLLMDRVKKEQEEIKQIELNKLQSQIQPHFLYNTLECIHWQALSDGNKIVSRMVKALANYYRLSLSKGRDLVTLSEELSNIENYLIIQNARYSDIIQLEIDIDDKMKKILVPKITLQPLIENSIYHGIRVRERVKGKILITVSELSNRVIVSVIDDGIGMSKEQLFNINKSISQLDENEGYGIKNVNKRIEMMFGTEYGLFYKQNKYGGTTVDIILPKGRENNV
ncbi:histidine kinase [Clostridium sp. DSM 100503]|uniref:sensor histidine kinase n=1 Tax=Clostridium sp. DSM 100503 TaxID=2963282 RepID=UPI002149FABF|nr:histidine kinase [Clostridium sp. DSM 100503]MCR1950743.1 histidine kinase [Clostridium sp. DSM 100503]